MPVLWFAGASCTLAETFLQLLVFEDSIVEYAKSVYKMKKETKLILFRNNDALKTKFSFNHGSSNLVSCWSLYVWKIERERKCKIIRTVVKMWRVEEMNETNAHQIVAHWKKLIWPLFGFTRSCHEFFCVDSLHLCGNVHFSIPNFRTIRPSVLLLWLDPTPLAIILLTKSRPIIIWLYIAARYESIELYLWLLCNRGFSTLHCLPFVFLITGPRTELYVLIFYYCVMFISILLTQFEKIKYWIRQTGRRPKRKIWTKQKKSWRVAVRAQCSKTVSIEDKETKQFLQRWEWRHINVYICSFSFSLLRVLAKTPLSFAFRHIANIF